MVLHSLKRLNNCGVARYNRFQSLMVGWINGRLNTTSERWLFVGDLERSLVKQLNPGRSNCLRLLKGIQPIIYRTLMKVDVFGKHCQKKGWLRSLLWRREKYITCDSCFFVNAVDEKEKASSHLKVVKTSVL